MPTGWCHASGGKKGNGTKAICIKMGSLTQWKWQELQPLPLTVDLPPDRRKLLLSKKMLENNLKLHQRAYITNHE